MYIFDIDLLLRFPSRNSFENISSDSLHIDVAMKNVLRFIIRIGLQQKLIDQQRVKKCISVQFIELNLYAEETHFTANDPENQSFII